MFSLTRFLESIGCIPEVDDLKKVVKRKPKNYKWVGL